MATSDELLNKMNESIAVLQSAQQTVVQGAERLGNAVHKTGDENIAGLKTFTTSPVVPTPPESDASAKAANMDALQRVKTQAATALAAADAAKTEAEGKVSKSGDTMTGNLILKGPARAISFNDVDDAQFGNLLCQKESDTYDASAYLRVWRIVNGKRKDSGMFGVMINADGIPYSAVPAPRESSYANDADTLRASINRHPIKLAGNTTFHVGGEGASDTADLFMGRGLTADKPFATLSAAISWVCQHYDGGFYQVTFMLHADMAVGDFGIYPARLGACVITSDSVKRTITLSGGFTVGYGQAIFQNVNMVSNGAKYFFNVLGADALLFVGKDVSLSGAVSQATIFATNFGNAMAIYPIDGSVTGKRYILSRCSRLITDNRGADAIPGTIAGACNASSVYA